MKAETVFLKVENDSPDKPNSYFKLIGERYIFTKEELIEHDKQIAENAFDAGFQSGMDSEFGRSTKGDKQYYIDSIINNLKS